MGWCDFRLPAVGTSYDNEDGTSRQAELRVLARGHKLFLVREPENPHDPRAVAVVSERQVRVAYLRRDHAGWVGSKIDRGYDVRAVVERIRGGALVGATLGLVLLLNMDGEEPVPDGIATLPPGNDPFFSQTPSA